MSYYVTCAEGKKNREDYTIDLQEEEEEDRIMGCVILCNLCRGKKNIEDYTIDLQEEEEDLIMDCHIM